MLQTISEMVYTVFTIEGGMGDIVAIRDINRS